MTRDLHLWSERHHGVCSRCEGGGRVYAGYKLGNVKCRHCDGTGKVPVWSGEWRPWEPQKETR